MTKQDNQNTQHEIPLSQALKDCRLAAGLSVEEVASKLNLNVTVIRNIEDNLEQVITDTTYQSIYLRGYLANYSKAVNLLNLESFQQYQQLSHTGKTVKTLNKPPAITDKKKSPINVKAILALVLIISIALLYAIVSGSFDAVETTVKPAENVENTQMRLPGNQPEITPSSRVNTETDTIQSDDLSSTNAVELDEINSDIEGDISATNNNIPNVNTTNDNVTNDNAPDNQSIAVDSTADTDVKLPVEIADNIDEIFSGNDKNNVTESVSVSLPDNNTATSTEVTHSLVVKFKEDCWTEIFDANGKRMALDLYKAGTELTLAGTPPFKLVLGNPFVVELVYQGELVEREYKRGRTARFNLPE